MIVLFLLGVFAVTLFIMAVIEFVKLSNELQPITKVQGRVKFK